MMAQVFGGRHTYGEAIGIMLMNKYKPRIPGDVGNATTFQFPVRYRVVEEAHGHRHRRADKSLVEPFVQAARELEQAGVRAITSSCGFLAFFQQDVADAVAVPVFLSSLIQVPMVHRMLRRDQKVGVLTVEREHLDDAHFEAVGAGGVPRVVYGMEKEPEFARGMIHDEQYLDPELLQKEVVSVCKRMASENPDVGAIVLECVQMPPYAAAVQEELGLPIFDIVTLTNMVFEAVVRRRYTGFL